MSDVIDFDAVCTVCRWKGAHSPECPRRDEPWPTIPMPELACTLPLDILETLLGLVMRVENPDEHERECIKTVARELQQIEELLKARDLQ